MRHLRPLPRVDSEEQDWFLATGTALFPATENGLQALKSHVESYFNMDSYEDAPVDLVLCTGAIDPDGPYTTIRRVEREIDLIDEWAPIGSEVPDPSLEKLRSDYERLKEKKENGALHAYSEEAAKWYLQKMKDDIYRIEAQLEEIEEAQKVAWDDDHPLLSEEAA